MLRSQEKDLVDAEKITKFDKNYTELEIVCILLNHKSEGNHKFKALVYNIDNLIKRNPCT